MQLSYAVLYSRSPSVCPSVRLSHASIVTKLIELSHGLRHWIAPLSQFSARHLEIQTESPEASEMEKFRYALSFNIIRHYVVTRQRHR